MINEKDISTLTYINMKDFQADKSQKFKYDNPLFACLADHEHYSSDMNNVIPQHWHEDLEYLFVIKGQLHYNVNGESMIIEEGTGIFVNSKRIHSNYSPINESCLFCFVIINPSYVCASPYIEQRFVEPIIGPQGPDYLILSDNDWTKSILDELKYMFDKPSDDSLELEIVEVSYRILRYMYVNLHNDLAKNIISTTYSESFKTMVSFVHENYAEKISLTDIANAGNVGKTLCAKLFRQFTQKTPGDYLITYRVLKGMELLRKTDMSITDIGLAVGFTSASHFVKTFREISGNTPCKYRKQTRG